MIEATQTNETLTTTRAAFFNYMKETRGNKDGTRGTYRKDFDLIVKHFGADKKIKNILPMHVAGFMKSEALLTRIDGERKNWRTIAKTARLLKIFLNWCLQTGRLEKLPIPRGMNLGGKASAQAA